MYHVEDLIKWNNKVGIGNAEIGWACARPEIGPFISRFRDAWQVLIGKADAINWHE